MTKKWEFEGEVSIPIEPFGVILFNTKEDDYEVFNFRDLCKRERLEGKKVKITIKVLEE